MLTKLCKDGTFAVLRDGDYSILFFDNEDKFKEWKSQTDKEGHTISSFYKIRRQIQQYSPVTKSEFLKEAN